MNNNKKWYFVLLSTVFFLNACISDYEHPDIGSGESFLVVEGFITNEITKVKLSWSVPLTGDVSSSPPVTQADVWVETKEGTFFGTYSVTEQGEYSIAIGELDANTEYRLRVVFNGEEYASEFLKPVFTPPITDIDSYKKEKGQPIQILLSTQGDPSGSPYYKWEYNEIWEVAPPMTANSYLEDPPYGTPIVSTEYNGFSPYHFAWKYAHSYSIILGNTSSFSENRIEKLKLLEFEPSDNRFQLLYYIKVRQNNLRDDAYEYFSQLKTTSEEIGSIFAPVPSELKGNIVCLTDPTISVIGYVEVSTTAEKEVFIENSPLYERPRILCYIHEAGSVEDFDGLNELGYIVGSFTIYQYYPPMMIQYTQQRCVDCRYIPGATKLKPDFWPNDHK